jgi:hypothetical protein
VSRVKRFHAHRTQAMMVVDLSLMVSLFLMLTGR